MEKLAKIEDAPGYAKDLTTRAVVSTDQRSLKTYKIQRERASSLQTAIDDINTLRNELSDIKSLLNQLVNSRIV
jgi:hypothetical protein